MVKKLHIHKWKILGQNPWPSDGILVGCEEPGCLALFGLSEEEKKVFKKAKQENKKIIKITDHLGVVHKGR